MNAVADGKLGYRAMTRLRESPDSDDLMLLQHVCDVTEGLAIIRKLDDGSA